MSRIQKAIACAALAAACAWQAQAQEPKPPAYSTTKVEGTDGVYVFSFGNRLSIFVVTPDGVIATDPGGYGQPQRVPTYLAEIRKVTDKPIKYLVYSHHHYEPHFRRPAVQGRGRDDHRACPRQAAARAAR